MPKNKGDAFRDQVAELLSAAGFGRVEVERKAEFKKVDISAVWTRHTIEGPVTYAIEAKNLGRTITLDQCSLFVTQYGGLVRAGAVDRAWLISQGPISPEGRKHIREASGRNLDCLTFSELQRRLLVIDSYLADLAKQFQELGVSEYYVQPHLTDDTPLAPLVVKWLDERSSNQLAIFGDYGQGKSTFALSMANMLLDAARADPTKRVPIVIPLGEIFDEQSIEGLLGKLLTSKHRVENYHFHLFSALNEQGRLVLIFDGFDEMKHGMTFAMFQHNISEIMRLDKGRAKIVILGRDTVFANDREFRYVILGRQFTAYGQEVPSLTRRPLRHVKLRGFSGDESDYFVQRYFSAKVRNGTQRRKEWNEAAWVRQRTAEISSHADLIRRPVHAQMLCDIATDPTIDLTAMSAYRLYDVFIHYLIDREIAKRGRFPGFGYRQRRKFSELLAWWLWRAGGASTTTFADIPAELFRTAVGEARHEFDEEGLRRELVIGCMVEKSGGGIFFPHRSIQEFLVAEHLWTELESISDQTFSQAGTPEVLEFLVERVELDKASGQPVKRGGAKLLSKLTTTGRRLDTITEFRRAFRIAVCLDDDLLDGIKGTGNIYPLIFFARNGRMDFDSVCPRAAEYLKSLTADLHARPLRAAPTLYLWLMCSYARASIPEDEIAEIIFLMFPRDQLAKLFKSEDKSSRVRGRDAEIIRKDRETLGLWFFLKFVSFESDAGVGSVVIDRAQALKELRRRGIGYDELETSHSVLIASTPLRCKIEAVLRHLVNTPMEKNVLKEVNSFLLEPRVRDRFVPQE